MAENTVQQHRTRTVSQAGEILEFSRDSLRDCASKLSDLTHHDADIARAKWLADEVDRLRSDIAGRELLFQIELEAMRREAQAAAEENRKGRERFERLDETRDDLLADQEQV